MTETFNFTFSFEEVLFLQHVLELPVLPGLDEDNPYASFTSEQMELVLGIAERGLRARGFLEVNNDGSQATLFSPVLALFTSCAAASAILLIMTEYDSEPVHIRYYHIGEHLSVERSFPQPGLHRFTAGPAFSDLSEQLRVYLMLSEQAAAGMPDIMLTQAALADARSTAIRDKNAALERLREDGLSHEQASLLAEALADLLCTVTFTVVYEAANGFDPQELGLIVTRDTAWFVTIEEPEQERFKLTSCSANEAVERILALAIPVPGDHN